MLVGVGVCPRLREVCERWRLSARPELHGEDPCDGTIPETPGSEFTERTQDAGVLFRVPAVIQTILRSRLRRWRVVPHDLCGDARGLTYLAGRQVLANASQHDWLSINILCDLQLSVRILGQNLPGD